MYIHRKIKCQHFTHRDEKHVLVTWISAKHLRRNVVIIKRYSGKFVRKVPAVILGGTSADECYLKACFVILKLGKSFTNSPRLIQTDSMGEYNLGQALPSKCSSGSRQSSHARSSNLPEADQSRRIEHFGAKTEINRRWNEQPIFCVVASKGQYIRVCIISI